MSIAAEQTINTKCPEPAMTTYELLGQFIDNHTPQIKRRIKGQREALRTQFITESGRNVSVHYFREFLTWYRRTHNIIMELAPNKYYKSRNRPATV